MPRSPAATPEPQTPAPRKAAWWFLVGHEPLLSLAEIAAVLGIPLDSLKPTALELPIVRLEASLEPTALMGQLGGTIKIAEEGKTALSEEDLATSLAKELRKQEGKITFGISSYTTEAGTEDFIKRLGQAVKKQLTQEGRSVRHVFDHEPFLSSASVEKNKLATSGSEFIIQKINDHYDYALTRAVQPFEAFGARDYGRPGRDDVSGMLPPKLALMMINLARGPRDGVLLDPFCGSGTIVSEALLHGYTQVVGSDLSERAVRDTEQNIAWLRETFPETVSDAQSFKFFQADSRDLGTMLASRSIDAIVTEPFLGPPLRGHESPETIKKNASELAKLYSDTFTAFKKILRPGASIVCIIPRFKHGDSWFTISDRIMPHLKELGFVKERLLPEAISPSFYLLYHRPKQRVGREIWKFTV